MNPNNTEELENHIKACIAGDQESFRYVFDYNKNKVFQYVLSRTSNREEALDITQEIFISLWQSLKKFNYRSINEFYGFMFLIARRRIIKYYRSRKPNVELVEGQLNQNFTMEERNLQNIEDHHDLLINIGRLRKKHQEILRLRYWSGLSYQEISQVLGITETTAKVWHHRAIETLKRLFNTYEID